MAPGARSVSAGSPRLTDVRPLPGAIAAAAARSLARRVARDSRARRSEVAARDSEASTSAKARK